MRYLSVIAAIGLISAYAISAMAQAPQLDEAWSICKGEELPRGDVWRPGFEKCATIRDKWRAAHADELAAQEADAKAKAAAAQSAAEATAAHHKALVEQLSK